MKKVIEDYYGYLVNAVEADDELKLECAIMLKWLLTPYVTAMHVCEYEEKLEPLDLDWAEWCFDWDMPVFSGVLHTKFDYPHDIFLWRFKTEEELDAFTSKFGLGGESNVRH